MSGTTIILPPPSKRARIAAAVHRGVCLATGTDGMAQCAVYAATAAKVLAEMTGARYIVQAGTLSVRLSRELREREPDGVTHFTMEARASHRGGVCGALGPGDLEFHAWAGRVHGRGAEPGLHEFVDLSARHYRHWVGALDPAWPGPGDFDGEYLWTAGDRLPDGVHLIPDMQTTFLVSRQLEGVGLKGIVGEAARAALEELRASDAAPKVGRNEPCPCGSGRKFKKCCADGALRAA